MLGGVRSDRRVRRLLWDFFSVLNVFWLVLTPAVMPVTSRCVLGPAFWIHRVPLGQGAGAASSWQAAPPTAD